MIYGDDMELKKKKNRSFELPFLTSSVAKCGWFIRLRTPIFPNASCKTSVKKNNRLRNICFHGSGTRLRGTKKRAKCRTRPWRRGAESGVPLWSAMLGGEAIDSAKMWEHSWRLEMHPGSSPSHEAFTAQPLALAKAGKKVCKRKEKKKSGLRSKWSLRRS